MTWQLSDGTDAFREEERRHRNRGPETLRSEPQTVVEREARYILDVLDPEIDSASDTIYLAASRKDKDLMIVGLRKLASLGVLAYDVAKRLEGGTD